MAGKIKKVDPEIVRAIESARSSEHVRWWIWIRFTRQGGVDLEEAAKRVGKKIVMEMVAGDLLRFDEETRMLYANKWSTTFVPTRTKVSRPTGGKLGKLTGRKQLRYAFDNRRLKGSAAVINEGIERCWKRVNKHRAEKGVHPLPHESVSEQRRYWYALAKRSVDVDIMDFLDFAYDEFEFLESKGIEYPGLDALAGKWIWERWDANSKAVKPSRSTKKIAGHTYKTPVDLRERLREAGFAAADKLNDGQLRYIEDEAKTRVEFPHLGSPQPRWEEEIAWLTTQLLKERDEDGDR